MKKFEDKERGEEIDRKGNSDSFIKFERENNGGKKVNQKRKKKHWWDGKRIKKINTIALMYHITESIRFQYVNLF